MTTARKLIPVLAIGLLLAAFTVRAQTYKPAVDYSSLMNLRFYEGNGGFYVDHLQLIFPPQSPQPYYFVIMTESGKVLQSVPLRIEKWQQFPMFDGLRIKGSPVVQVGKPGKYNLAVTMGKTPLTILPFSMQVSKNNDPFNPQQTFVRDGLWSALAYLSRKTDRPDAPLFFNWWTNLREYGLSGGNAKCTVELMIGNTTFAEVVSDVVVSSVNWQFFSRRLRTPKNKGKKNLTLAMLTAKDGDYRLRVTANGKTVKSYKLGVQNGQVQPLPFNNLNYEPHANFISPRIIDTSDGSGSSYKMLDAFWVQRVKE